MMIPTNMKALEAKMAALQGVSLSEKVYWETENLWIAPQFRGGKSQWAKWLEKGLIESSWVMWAWRELPSGHNRPLPRRQWLAIRLDSGKGKSAFIDLVHPSGSAKLRNLEKKMAKFISDRLQHQKEIAAMNTLTEKEVWDFFSDPTLDVRVEIEKKGWTLQAYENGGSGELDRCEILYAGGPDKVAIDLKTKTVKVYYF